MMQNADINVASEFVEFKRRVNAFVRRPALKRWICEFQKSAYYEPSAKRTIVFPAGATWISGYSIRSKTLLTFFLHNEIYREKLHLIYKKGELSKIKFIDYSFNNPIYFEAFFQGSEKPVKQFKRGLRNRAGVIDLPIPPPAENDSFYTLSPSNNGDEALSLLAYHPHEPRILAHAAHDKSDKIPRRSDRVR